MTKHKLRRALVAFIGTGIALACAQMFDASDFIRGLCVLADFASTIYLITCVFTVAFDGLDDES